MPLNFLQEPALSGCRGKGEEVLIAQGWERRFVAEPKAAEEARKNYEELGYTVKLVPIDTQAVRPECAGCQATLEKFQIIFTRR